MRSLQILALYGAAMLGAFMTFDSGTIVPYLTLVVGLAIAGPGRRALWFLAVVALLGLVGGVCTQLPPGFLSRMDGNPYLGTLAFGLVPLVPALLLWMAHAMREPTKVSRAD